jgi:hypothetical protein
MKSLGERDHNGSPGSINYVPGRGVVVALLGTIGLGIVLTGFLFWYIPTVGLGNIHPALPYILGGAVLVTGAFIITGIVVIVLSIMRGGELSFPGRFRWLLVKVLFPLMVLVGGLVKIPRIKMDRAFIELNNRMVRPLAKSFRPEKLLMLMPHCIQWDDCKMKVTRNVRNCVGCNKCEIGELVEISDEYGVELFIATGGTVARRKVTEHRPDALVAVACERDLASGIQDAYPLPVLAIVNKRPQGYCMNAGVEMEEVKGALRELLGEGGGATPPVTGKSNAVALSG